MEKVDRTIKEKLKVYIRQRPPQEGDPLVSAVAGDDEGNVFYDDKVSPVH